MLSVHLKGSTSSLLISFCLSEHPPCPPHPTPLHLPPSSSPHPTLLLCPWWSPVVSGHPVQGQLLISVLLIAYPGPLPLASRTPGSPSFLLCPWISLLDALEGPWLFIASDLHMMASSRAWLSHLFLHTFLPWVSVLPSCWWAQVYLRGPAWLIPRIHHQHLPECYAIWNLYVQHTAPNFHCSELLHLWSSPSV